MMTDSGLVHNDHRPLMERFTEVFFLQQGIFNRDGADGIVRETALRREEVKMVIVGRVELKTTADNISDDGS